MAVKQGPNLLFCKPNKTECILLVSVIYVAASSEKDVIADAWHGHRIGILSAWYHGRLPGAAWHCITQRGKPATAACSIGRH
jgi:hypothetical protein